MFHVKHYLKKQSMINNVVLVGRLTKDVDLRYTGSGTAMIILPLQRPPLYQCSRRTKRTSLIV